MPWLTRQNNADSTSSDDASYVTRPSMVNSKVSFIPAQIDGLCGTSISSLKKTPLQILMNDIHILTQNLNCLLDMVKKVSNEKIWLRYQHSWGNSKDALLQLCLGMMQTSTVFAVIPIFLFLPGSIFALCGLAFWAMTVALSWALNGKRVVTIKRSAAPMTADLSDERWFYVNGPMTSDRSLYHHCERISHTFSREITGIHNSTHGPILDLLSTLFLRAAGYPTSCTRTLTSQLRDACLNNSIRKVIVLGHSTGALHISLALGALHADLPVDVLSKLEIYTFGAASTHLSNPLLRLESLKSAFSPTETTQATFTRADGTIKSPVKATLASLGHRIEDHERVITHVEHYALQNDLSARCGILHSIRNVLDGRFCGRVFIMSNNQRSASKHGSGFLFEEHYLDALFPLNSHGSVLDEVVSVDISTAEKREFTAMGVALPMKSIIPPDRHRESIDGIMMGVSSPELSPKLNGSRGKRAVRGALAKTSENRSSWGTAGALGIDGVGKARMGARECEGRTARQLSRLWRYVQGGRPIGEGVPVMNGVGVGCEHGHGMTQ